MDHLWSPISFGGGLELPNRLIMAPCTRNRSTSDLSPPSDAVDHYADRASAGLIITEATLICEQAQAYIDTPGLFLDSHVDAWKRVVDRVHQRDGRIFAQLWHTGRVSHSYFTGRLPVAPSAVVDRVERRQQGVSGIFNECPLALEDHEILALIDGFAAAATRAKRAGFDGVELHGGNGYLIEQFLRLHTNRRDDRWGGDPSSRARFGIEVIRACVEIFGPGRVGVRLSPSADFGEMVWTRGDNEAFLALLQAVAPMGLAYVHTAVTRDVHVEALGMSPTAFLRAAWPYRLIANGGYGPAEADELIRQGGADMVSLGRLFLANPDLVPRLRSGRELMTYSPSVRLPPTYARVPAGLRSDASLR
jgi:N-ethylmaleimide reductase